MPLFSLLTNLLAYPKRRVRNIATLDSCGIPNHEQPTPISPFVVIPFPIPKDIKTALASRSDPDPMKTVLLQEAERCVALSWRGTAVPAPPLKRTMHNSLPSRRKAYYEKPPSSVGFDRALVRTKTQFALMPAPHPRGCSPLPIVSVLVKAPQWICNSFDPFKAETAPKNGILSPSGRIVPFMFTFPVNAVSGQIQLFAARSSTATG